MKESSVKGCIAIGGIVACYGIYAFSNPGTDGYIFGTVIAAVAGLGGWTIAKMTPKAPEG